MYGNFEGCKFCKFRVDFTTHEIFVLKSFFIPQEGYKLDDV